MPIIADFAGIAPKAEPHVLAPNRAQTAQDCRFDSGDLRPFQTASTVAVTLGKAGTITSIYRFGRDTVSDTASWFHWTTDVDVVIGPVPTDTTERTYYTGDGVPKYTDSTIGVSGGDMPAASYTLGLPAPLAATTPSVGGTATDTETEDRVYVYTYISEFNGYVQESKPSPVTSAVTVQTGETVTLTGFSAFPAGAYNFTGLKYYCAGADGIYRYVGETTGAVPASFEDTLATDERGAELQSAEYDPPSSTLAGLVSMKGNGVLAGFDGLDVFFCEPYIPHAWPASYAMVANSPVVGLGTFGTNLVVLTTGMPEIISGVEPASMSQQPLDFPQACASKRSIANVPGGVIYASPDGLCFVGEGGPRNLTEDLYTPEQWRAQIDPTTILGCWFENRYIGFYDNGTTQGGFVFEPKNAKAPFSLVTYYGTAAYVDLHQDALFFVDASRNLRKWGGGGADLSYTWRSKTFEQLTDGNIGVVSVQLTGTATVKIYTDGVLLKSKACTGPKVIFRVADDRFTEMEVEITGTGKVRRVGLFRDMDELRRAG